MCDRAGFLEKNFHLAKMTKNGQKWPKNMAFGRFKKITSLVLSGICVKRKILWFINILRVAAGPWKPWKPWNLARWPWKPWQSSIFQWKTLKLGFITGTFFSNVFSSFSFNTKFKSIETKSYFFNCFMILSCSF